MKRVTLRCGFATVSWSSRRPLRAELAALRDEQTRLERDNAELALSNETLNAGNAQLREQNAAFQGTVNNLQNQIVTLVNERQELRRTSEREAQKLA